MHRVIPKVVLCSNYWGNLPVLFEGALFELLGRVHLLLGPLVLLPRHSEGVQAAVLPSAEDDVGVGGRPEAAVQPLLVARKVGHLL